MQTTRKSLITFLGTGLLLLLAFTAQAADYYVDANAGNDGNSGLSAVTALEHIQTAINIASAGDTIYIAAGTYPESLAWQNKDLSLQGAGAGQTIVDPSQGNGGIGIYTENLTSASYMNGLTFQNAPQLGHDGGGMFNWAGSLTVTNCEFSGNTASSGGGMYNFGGGPTVTNCVFSGNSVADIGGGMVNRGSRPTVTNCIFRGNSAGNTGGGMVNDNNSSPSIINCTFSGNSATYGGGMENAFSSPIVTNCIFSGNGAGNAGGGMRNFNSNPAVTNCTFSGNVAGIYNGPINFGGGMFNDTSSPALTNCIVWGNTSPQGGSGIYSQYASPLISHSDVQDYGLSSTPDANGNFAANPLFVRAPGTNGSSDFGDLHVQAGSPCIDSGSDTAIQAAGVTTDLDGNPRISGAHVDLGAYEFHLVFSWSGVLAPINASGSSVFKLGSTVPVKFQLTGASAGITTLTARLSYAKLSNGTAGDVNEAVSTAAATSGNLFRYDPASGLYIYNWKTKGLTTGTYRLYIDLGDGVSHTVDLGLK